MSRKKGLLEKLFGGSSGGCSCGIKIAEEKPQKAGCCNMQIVEETEQCCDSEDHADKNNENG